jgi:NitT/TauT family transport system substrate-binding protein
MKLQKTISGRFITLVIVSLILAVSLGSSCAKRPQKVKVGYLPINLSLPFFVAVEKGYFAQAGIEVEPVQYTTADQLTNALLAGNIDMTANTSTSTFLSTIEESPGFGEIYMISFHDPENYLDALLVKKGSSIKRVEDLKGKKIGIFPGSTNVVNLSIALSNFKINSKSDVEIVQLPPENHIGALASGQVDALYTLEPLVTVAVGQGIGEVLVQGLNAKYIVNPFPGGAYVVSRKFYQANLPTARKAIDSLYQAVDFIRSNEAEARNFYEKYTPIKGNIAQKTHIGAWWKLQEIQKDKVQKLADILYDNKILKKKANVEDYYLR